MKRPSIIKFVLAAGLASGVTFASLAQGPGPGDASPPGGGDQMRRPMRDGEGPRNRAPITVDAMRKWLSKRLDASRAMTARLEEALGKLDKGEDPGEVQRSLGSALREHMQAMRAEMPGAGNGPNGPNGPRPGDDMGGPMNDRPDRPEGPGMGGPEGRPGEGPGGPGAGPRGKMSAEERQALRELVRENRPELAKKIDAFVGKEPRGADRVIEGVGNKFRDLPELRQREPELFALRLDELDNTIEIMQRTRVWRELREAKADQPKLDAARAEVRKAMSDQFELHLKLQQHQVAKVKERAAKLEAEIAKMRELREKSLDERTDAVLRGPRPGPGARGPGAKGDKPDHSDKPGER
jgi:hypothetical protein